MTENHTAMKNGITAFILSAGFGERMKPVTHHRPKPLLPVPGGPLVINIIEKLYRFGIKRIALNIHHLEESFTELFNESLTLKPGYGISEAVQVFDFPGKFGNGELLLVRENELLGTGGGLANLFRCINPPTTVLVHNGDVLCDFQLVDLLNGHKTGKRDITLLLTGNTSTDCVTVDREGTVLAIYDKPAPASGKNYTYTGISLMEPSFLEKLPRKYGPVVPFFQQCLKETGSIGSSIARGRWRDLGTVESYLETIRQMTSSRDVDPGDSVELHGRKYFNSTDGSVIEKSSRWTEDCRTYRNNPGILLAEKGAKTEEGAVLKNVVLLEGSSIREWDFFDGGIIGRGFSCEPGQYPAVRQMDPEPHELKSLEDSKLLEDLAGPKWWAHSVIRKIACAGSSRLFYRISQDSTTPFILMDCRNDRAGLGRFAAVQSLLVRAEMGPPEVLGVSTAEASAVMEDLGQTSLQDMFRRCTSENEVISLYRQVVEYLASFHVRATNELYASNLRLHNHGYNFSYWRFRWESTYFLHYFIKQYCASITGTIPPGLDSELHGIASSLASETKMWSHRDFQSQNIFFKGGKVRVVDFQDGRMAPGAYDLASLLRDAYVRIPVSAEQKLLGFYIECLDRESGSKTDREAFLACYRLAALSRGMQALGAFAKLSAKDGKKEFRAHIPRGLTNLRRGLLENDEFPVLREMVLSMEIPEFKSYLGR